MRNFGNLRTALVIGLLSLTPARGAGDEWKAYFDRGYELYQAGKYPEALAAYERSLNAARRDYGPESANYSDVLNRIALVYRDQGELEKAADVFRRTLVLRESQFGGRSRFVADTINNLALVHADLGHYEEAETLYRRALATYEAALGRGDSANANPINNLGSLFVDTGRYAEAEAMYRRSLAIRETAFGKNHPDTAASYNNLGNLYRATGRLVDAERNYRQSLVILEGLLDRDHPTVAQGVHNVAVALYELGQYDQAEVLFRRSLASREKMLGKDHADVAQTLLCLATLFDAKDEPKKATELFRRSVAIYEARLGKEHPLVAHALGNQAVNHFRLDQHDQAEPLFRRSLAIFTKKLGADHPMVAYAESNLGLLYLDRAEYDRAAPLLRHSLAVREAKLLPEHHDVATTLSSLGKLSAAQGRWDDAAGYFDRARQCARKYVANVLPTLSLAEQLDFLDTKDVDHLAFGLTLGWQRRGDAAVCSRSAEWLLNAKAIGHEALAEQTLLERGADSDAARVAVQEFQDVRRLRATLLMAAPNPGREKDHARQLDDLANRQRSLEKQVSEAGGPSLAAGRWVTLAEVRKALPADAVLIDVFRFRPYDFTAKVGGTDWQPARYVVWIVPPAGKGDVQVVDLGEAEAIEAQVAVVRKALASAPKKVDAAGEADAEKELRTELEKLSRQVLRPLHAAVGTSTRWVLSPDAALWLVPWAALPLPDGGYAVEKHSLQYVVSGRDLIASRAAGAVKPSRPVILADPDFELDVVGVRAAAREVLDTATSGAVRGVLPASQLPKVSRLPGTAAEAKAVKPSLEQLAKEETWVYKGKYALEGVVKSVQRPRVLVLSTHGFFLDEPDGLASATAGSRSTRATLMKAGAAANPLARCGLLLTGCNSREPRGADDEDGVLTGLEVIGCDLRGCELVVLSACETGLGKVNQGEGVAGLRQAFQLAGARSVVASLWQVPDRDTALLITGFFDGLAAGKDKADALRAAQLARIQARRDRGGAAHPYFWAAFTVTGQ